LSVQTRAPILHTVLKKKKKKNKEEEEEEKKKKKKEKEKKKKGKVKLSQCMSRRHRGGVEVQPHPILTSSLDGGE